jgi:hypothetical protein
LISIQTEFPMMPEYQPRDHHGARRQQGPAQEKVGRNVGAEPSRAGSEARGRRGLGQAMEINEFQKRLTDEACFLRGQIITGYSMVEYVLADISVRLDMKFGHWKRVRCNMQAAILIAIAFSVAVVAIAVSVALGIEG